MLNKLARKTIEECLARALAQPLGEMAAAEADLNFASGLISYALFRDDITFEQSRLLQLRVTATRQRRSVVLRSAAACAYKWEYIHILKHRSPSSGRSHLGTAIHASTAAFDVSRMNGSNLSAYDTAELLVHTLRNPDQDVDWKADKLTLAEAERIALPLHTRYCTEISPRYEFVAVERTTEPLEIDCGSGVIIRLTGQLDRSRICKAGDGKGIADVKTGGAAVVDGVAKTKGHWAQIGTYEILEEHTTGEPCTAPAHIIGLKTKGKPETGIGEIVGAKQMMVGTDDYPGLIQIGADMLRSGLFPPNPQSFLCSAKYCPRWSTCPYHQ